RFAAIFVRTPRARDQLGPPRHPAPQHPRGLAAQRDEEAIETWWQYWQPVVAALSQERGFYQPTRERYLAEVDKGALFVGSPETVARKIATMARALHLDRFDLKYDVMHLPREARARTIELLGREVAPRVRELLAKEAARA
ncbi:LLM class flavin-dependent oxidoreductase, partial [Streptomyces sp. NPDC059378]